MNNVTVLVVDDESRMRKLIKDFLVQKEFSVIEAEDGEKALEILKEAGETAYVIGEVVEGNKEINIKY